MMPESAKDGIIHQNWLKSGVWIVFYLLRLASGSIVINQAFQNEAKHEFGLDEEGNKHCMVLRFGAAIYNLNLRDRLAIEDVDFANESVKLIGFCSKRNELQKHSQLQASWRVGERRKGLKFVFREHSMMSSARMEELRWRLESLEFVEKFKGRSVKFSSGENVTLAVNAPLNQKFVCRDAINLTLRNARYKDVIVQLLPVVSTSQLELQPVATAFGLGNNMFICERTRRRTLRESFQNKMTVFSGILLGFGSVGMIVGYSIWKQMPAQRNSLEKAQRREQYANIE